MHNTESWYLVNRVVCPWLEIKRKGFVIKIDIVLHDVCTYLQYENCLVCKLCLTFVKLTHVFTPLTVQSVVDKYCVTCII